jgi:hypothetical protein
MAICVLLLQRGFGNQQTDQTALEKTTRHRINVYDIVLRGFTACIVFDNMN